MWKYNHTDDLYTNSDHLYHSADELYHFGIPGMKWGVRKSKEYKNAKSNYKQAKKNARSASLKLFGNRLVNNGLTGASEYRPKSASKSASRFSDRNKTQAQKVSAKARLKSLTKTKTNRQGYNKAEFNTYVKGQSKAGLPGSNADRRSGGKGTAMYNQIARTKGKTYANAVLKKTGRKKTKAVITGTAIAIGMNVAAQYGVNQYAKNFGK